MIDAAIRICALALGLAGLFVFFRSIARVALLNRRQKDGIADLIGKRVLAVVTLRARAQTDFASVQKTMAWVLPLLILGMIAAWFILVQVSYALVLLAVEPDISLGKSLIASGSALSTLGFATPPDWLGQSLAIAEGATGLGIVVFMFTFIPGYAAAVEAREDKAGWIYARAGSRPTISSFLEWHLRADGGSDMTPLWNDWENWFRALLETHSLTPILAAVPSIYEDRTWVGAATVMLDTASLALTTVDGKGRESARLCLETGVSVLGVLAGELTGGTTVAGGSNNSELATAYDAAYECLAMAGFTVRPQRDECRQDFLALRARYEGFARQIAEAVVMPAGQPWVIPRQAGR